MVPHIHRKTCCCQKTGERQKAGELQGAGETPSVSPRQGSGLDLPESGMDSRSSERGRYRDRPRLKSWKPCRDASF